MPVCGYVARCWLAGLYFYCALSLYCKLACEKALALCYFAALLCFRRRPAARRTIELIEAGAREERRAIISSFLRHDITVRSAQPIRNGGA